MMRMNVAALSLCALTLAASAHATQPAASPSKVSVQDAPAPLRPPEGLLPFKQVGATGVQVHECAMGQDGALAWQFRRPEAMLLDTNGTTLGDHGAGPFWRLLDGSRIVARVQASSPSPHPGAVPWLLLTVTSRSGDGELSTVEAVQRVNTWGGVMPNRPCDAAHAGNIESVPYRADYVFWQRAPQR